ncbi:hypothetical protein PROPEN_03232 [Proteus penneri ATCC 35198]|nr:hypothetical protein PROPEN_03232 [Proteus penneri ATCC 35198]
MDWKGIDEGFFWASMQGAVEWRLDLVNCFIKSVVFAITVTWIALLTGMTQSQHQKGLAEQQHVLLFILR